MNKRKTLKAIERISFCHIREVLRKKCWSAYKETWNWFSFFIFLFFAFWEISRIAVFFLLQLLFIFLFDFDGDINEIFMFGFYAGLWWPRNREILDDFLLVSVLWFFGLFCWILGELEHCWLGSQWRWFKGFLDKF